MRISLVLKFSYFSFSLAFLTYLLLPTPAFPDPPTDAIQSFEAADTETPFRRSYFTDYTRREVLKHYQTQFVFSYRLNYPPEEAYSLIRDQTRSTFLEEIVHPLRESLFVNGFEPKNPKDAIFINDKFWRQKITVKYVPSRRIIRLPVGLVTLTVLFIISKLFFNSSLELLKILRAKRLW